MYRRIRDLREDHDFTQEYSAKYLSCSQSAYSRIEISSEKEFLSEEKVNIETTLKSEVGVKKRLTEFKHLLSSQKILTEFDRTVFESIIEKIIVGGVNSDGEIDPAILTIIFKTGETQNKNGKKFKSKRKNAKLEPDKLCPQNSDEDKKIVF